MVKEAAIPSTKQAAIMNEAKPQLPTSGNLAVKCPKCKEIIYGRDWEKNLKVCPRCNHHFRLPARERIALLLDPESFVELDAQMIPADPLHFVVNPPNASKTLDYASKLVEERQKAGQNEAVISGYGMLDGLPLTLAIMDFHFMGGSMGSVVGEKITRAIESAIERHTPML